MFNASLLSMCSIVFDNVTYLAGKDSSNNVTRIAEKHLRNNVDRRYCFVWKGNGRWNFLMRFVTGALQNFRFLLVSSKDVTLIFNYNNLFALRLLNWLNKYARRNVLVFCHGELEALSSDINKAGLLSRLLNKLAKNFFYLIGPPFLPGCVLWLWGPNSKKTLVTFSLRSRWRDLFV